MKFPKEDLIEIAFGDCPSDEFSIVEEGGWIAEHKYQLKDVIFKYKDKFYMLCISRSGSPFSDYYYCWEDWNDEEDVDEVEPVEKTIIVTDWRKVS